MLDLSQEVWPDRTFDIVICSEVLEHIPDWPAAVANLARMAREYVLITVPTGKVRAMDRMVGHTQHFAGPELVAALGAAGCWPLEVRRWGFPVHSLYRMLISAQADRVYDAFSGEDGGGLRADPEGGLRGALPALLPERPFPQRGRADRARPRPGAPWRARAARERAAGRRRPGPSSPPGPCGRSRGSSRS